MATAAGLFAYSFFAVVVALLKHGVCKECTNTFTQPSSHTLRYALLSSSVQQGPSFNEITGHIEHVAAAYFPEATMLNRNAYYEIAQPISRGQEESAMLQEISLHNVRLLADSLQGIAQQTNLKYLLMLDVDKLVWSFRNTSNLSSPGFPYGGWEAPTSELRGHFVGHYMSATALIWASTHDKTLHQKMTDVVDVLFECQQKVGTGYLSAFPSEFFDRFEQLKPVWAPYYTVHKILAGLLDQYTYAGNKKAFTMAVRMADYFSKRVKEVIQTYTIERHWLSLNEETGGMNDALYRLYMITGNPDHLELAHLFDKPCFLGILAVEADSISGFHSNTHIPIVVGAQVRYEVTADELYKDMSVYFMDIVNSSHSYPTGGTSSGEFWTDPSHLGDTLFSTETEESCTTYNMLKVARHLFCWTKKMKYVDYYERAVINGILSIQRGQEPGVMIYMLPMGKGLSKAISYHGWGTPFNSFWCCYGTGIESFSKLGDSIYFEELGSEAVLYIVQFVSSSVSWNSTGLILYQMVRDLSSNSSLLQAQFEFSAMNKMSRNHFGMQATLKLRVPFWAAPSSGSVSLNNETLESVPIPGEFLSITRVWEAGDHIMLSFDVLLRAEKVRDNREEYASLHAIFFGPYLLAALSIGDWDITGVDVDSLTDWITPITDSDNLNVYSFSQRDSVHHLYMSCFWKTCNMCLPPKEGTNEASWAAFRLVDPFKEKLVSQSCLNRLQHSKLSSITAHWPVISMKTETVVPVDSLLGRLIAIEPISQPGSYVRHAGDNSIGVVKSSKLLRNTLQCECQRQWYASTCDVVFRIIPGLSSDLHSVSFEAASKPGCFLSRYLNSIHLTCDEGLDSTSIKSAGTFIVNQRTAMYPPMSFMARGENQNFVLSPLISYRDQNYTVFLNITSQS